MRCNQVDLSGIGAIRHELIDLLYITSPFITFTIRACIARGEEGEVTYQSLGMKVIS